MRSARPKSPPPDYAWHRAAPIAPSASRRTKSSISKFAGSANPAPTAVRPSAGSAGRITAGNARAMLTRWRHGAIQLFRNRCRENPTDRCGSGRRRPPRGVWLTCCEAGVQQREFIDIAAPTVHHGSSVNPGMPAVRRLRLPGRSGAPAPLHITFVLAATDPPRIDNSVLLPQPDGPDDRHRPPRLSAP